MRLSPWTVGKSAYEPANMETLERVGFWRSLIGLATVVIVSIDVRPAADVAKWTATVTKMGLKGLHFHDLRHAGNTWAAQAGTSTRDLMTRMGRDDMRAALIYQHATNEADKAIADRLSAQIDQHRGRVDAQKPTSDDDDGGTAGALAPTGQQHADSTQGYLI